MKSKLQILALLFLLFSAASAQFTGAMVVRVDEGGVHCSAGSDSGLKVGESVRVLRGTDDLGTGTVVSVDSYQSTILVQENLQIAVGDRVLPSVQQVAAGEQQVSHSSEFGLRTVNESWVSKSTKFKAKVGGRSGSKVGSVAQLYGLYRLVDNQVFLRRNSFRGAATEQLALDVAGFLLYGLRRGPRVAPAKVEFVLSVREQDLKQRVAPLEVVVEIRNTGAHELRFELLEEHLFVLDSRGERLA